GKWRPRNAAVIALQECQERRGLPNGNLRNRGDQGRTRRGHANVRNFRRYRQDAREGGGHAIGRAVRRRRRAETRGACVIWIIARVADVGRCSRGGRCYAALVAQIPQGRGEGRGARGAIDRQSSSSERVKQTTDCRGGIDQVIDLV